MARLPGPDMEKSLSGQFGGELTFAAPDDQLQASALGGMQWKEADGIHVACEEDAVHGVMRLPDLFGAPALLVHIKRPSAWRASATIVHGTYLLALVVGSILLLMFLEQRILFRVAALRNNFV